MGKTIQERPVWEEMKRRMGVSLRLLLARLACSAPPRGWPSACSGPSNSTRGSTTARRPGRSCILSTPVFLLAVLLKVAGTHYWNANVPDAGFDLYFVGEYTPGLGGGFFDAAP